MGSGEQSWPLWHWCQHLCPQRGSGTERPVQRLQFPHWEPGQELPATTLLPFLAAVGKCCSQDTEKPGTLLSHSRCCWTRAGGGGRRNPSLPPVRAAPPKPGLGLLRRTQSPFWLCSDVFQDSVPSLPGHRLAMAVPSVPPWSPGPGWVSPPPWVLSPPPRPQVSLQLKVNCSKGAAPLGTFLAVDRLLQQAGAEGTVDIFTVALQQSQACGLLTPTLVRAAGLSSGRSKGVGRLAQWWGWGAGPGSWQLRVVLGPCSQWRHGELTSPLSPHPLASAPRSSTHTSTAV